MGRRKFRLTVQKNYEKKKYQKRLTVAVDTVCDVTLDLVIHVPINLYHFCFVRQRVIRDKRLIILILIEIGI